jgi:hypothetical protein
MPFADSNNVSQSNSFVSLTGVTSRRSAGDVGTVETIAALLPVSLLDCSLDLRSNTARCAFTRVT